MGFGLGYWMATTPAEQRRAKAEEVWGGVRGNPRVQRLTETVQQRFSSTTDSAVAQDAGSSNETVVTPGTSGPGDGRSTIV